MPETRRSRIGRVAYDSDAPDRRICNFMLYAEFLVALIIALVLSAVMVGAFRWQRPGAKGYWSSMLYLFTLLFVASWAGGVWVSPVGASVWGVYWLPFLITGFVFALLLLAVMPYRRPRSAEEAKQQAQLRAGSGAIISVAFWILIIALAISIISYYA